MNRIDIRNRLLAALILTPLIVGGLVYELWKQETDNGHFALSPGGAIDMAIPAVLGIIWMAHAVRKARRRLLILENEEEAP